MKSRLIVCLFTIIFASFLTDFASASTTYYTYDDLQRLTRVERSDGTVIAYSYDELGNRISKVVTNVPLIPTALFTANQTNGSAPFPVIFTDQSTGNIASWLWDFGDGQTSSLQSPPHEYQTSGTYTVRLTVTGPTGTSDIEEKVGYITVIGSVDTDADGMPDSWEIEHNLNRYVDDALEDPDVDGFCNLREYLSGTDPRNQNDKPSILADFENDNDVDGKDLTLFIDEFGRADCDTAPDPCEFDFNTDGDVDEVDLWIFIEDYGRSTN